jgi:adhesin/invasin
MKISKILLLVFISSQTVAQTVDVSPISSGLNNSAPTPSMSGNPLADKLTQLAQSSMSGSGSGGIANSVQNQASSYLSSEGSQVLNNLFSTSRGTTEIGATTMQNGLPMYNILLVRPIYESADKIHTTFTQMSAFTQNGRTTGNFGLGYRQLVADKKILLGTNAFYDYEFPYGNQRTSVGGEIRSSVGELNLNYYMGTSGWVSGANGLQEKSLGGYNAELAVALPYMPTTQLRVNSFSWTGVTGLPNTSGTQYSMTGAIWWGLNLDIGRYQYNDNALPNANYARLFWIFGGDLSPNQKQFRFTEYAYKLESMENRRYEKVRRENIIVKATRSSSYTVGIIGY